MKCEKGIGSEDICPAASDDYQNCNGINNGSHGGRICWEIVGTHCGFQIKGSNTVTISDCKECTFYAQVLEEEGTAVSLTIPGLK